MADKIALVEEQGVTKQVILAALVVLLADWDSAQKRTGRRGEYLTTGALSTRFRELPEEVQRGCMEAVALLGLDVNDGELDAFFNAGHEYQVSYSINRFGASGSSGKTLTSNELRSVERVRTLIEKKGKAVLDKLTA